MENNIEDALNEYFSFDSVGMEVEGIEIGGLEIGMELDE